ncbi:MAG: pentapeptide repeat-containing protein, partial [Leptolyngbya sp. SIO3F4]|nr:pentapeptide repeat-containing protein [Leptolyngbya sp. SIO3F4]
LRTVDLSRVNLSGANLSRVNLQQIDLRGIKLQSVNLTQAQLVAVNFVHADLQGVMLMGANLQEAKLQGANLQKAYLVKANLKSANLSWGRLQKANLTGADLSQAILCDANLTQAYLLRASLAGADLRQANLKQAICEETQFLETKLGSASFYKADATGASFYKADAIGANFQKAILTGACIEDWNINSATSLEDVVCEHVYLKENAQERRPHGGSFQPGEFTQRFQKFLETVDLFFVDGIDWRAFLSSFQDLQAQYDNDELTVQGIERKSGGGFEVRLSVSPEADKAAIEKDAYQKYELNLQRLEAQYRDELTAKDSDIQRYQQQSQNLDALLSANRQHNADLMETIKLLASRPITIEATAVAENNTPKYDMRGAQIAGGVADKVQGNQVGGTIHNESAETLSLAEATAEIQSLLKQLEAANPNASEADQAAFLNLMIPPTKRERFTDALKSADSAAIEEISYASVLKALVEGWQ